ncbi:hypothetical protein G4B88_005095 [Cannabis sativa]|uniref:RNase H type-1 domain-containing protein n=1 Tax=Cannabis sativa TaxID=3483 RepID=A0A7J6H4L5_CANSA|nr:hypothetical protein G4B88_005095 [Cannabis sativa]
MMNGDEQILGNPFFIHGNNVSKFKFVVDKVANRLEGWKAKLLSQVARTVLVQNVIQTVPLYSMAVFKLPSAILANLDYDLNPLVKERLVINELIDCDSGDWNLAKLSVVFSPGAVANLQSIVPSDLDSHDSLVWTPNSSSNFSVKSAYWALNKHLFSVDNSLYKQLWESCFHPRVKLFLLKLYRDALPTGSRLAAIFGNEFGLCCMCHAPSANSTEHLFGHSDVVKKLWFLPKWGIRIGAFDLSNGRKVLNWIFNAPFSKEKEARAVDDFRIGCSLQLEMMSKLIGREFEFHWNLALDNRAPPPPHPIAGFSHEPSDGFIIEVDAAFGKENMTMGVVVKDQSKQLVAMYVSKCKLVGVIHGELLAALKGIEVSLLLGLNRGVILSDCQALTKAVKAKAVPNWSMASSFSKFLQAVEGAEFSLHWIPRSANRGAHTLAKWGLNNSCSGFVSLWDVNPHVFTTIISS